jgi:hypothetical protein
MERKREIIKLIGIGVILGYIDIKSCNRELCSDESLEILSDYSSELAKIIDMKKYRKFVSRDGKYHYKWSQLIREISELNLNIENLNCQLLSLRENLISSIKNLEEEIILEYQNWIRQEIKCYYQDLFEFYDKSFEKLEMEKFRY